MPIKRGRGVQIYKPWTKQEMQKALETCQSISDYKEFVAVFKAASDWNLLSEVAYSDFQKKIRVELSAINSVKYKTLNRYITNYRSDQKRKKKLAEATQEIGGIDKLKAKFEEVFGQELSVHQITEITIPYVRAIKNKVGDRIPKATETKTGVVKQPKKPVKKKPLHKPTKATHSAKKQPANEEFTIKPFKSAVNIGQEEALQKPLKGPKHKVFIREMLRKTKPNDS